MTKKVHELLNDPNRWTQVYFARNEHGQSTLPSGEDAVCWCLEGAIMKCYDCISQDVLIKTTNYIYNKHGLSITEFNDNSTYEEVLAVAKELDI